MLLPPALATGRLTLVTGAMAREVTTDAEGLATGVSYVDTAAGKDRHVRARIVVLAASACESARLLLNSRSSRHPAGPGQLERGRRPLSDRHRRHQHRGLHPARSWTSRRTTRTASAACTSTCPWWLDNKTLDFPRGYHIELGGGRGMPSYGFGAGIDQVQGGGYGQALKDDYRRYYGAFVGFAGAAR